MYGYCTVLFFMAWGPPFTNGLACTIYINLYDDDLDRWLWFVIVD